MKPYMIICSCPLVACTSDAQEAAAAEVKHEAWQPQDAFQYPLDRRNASAVSMDDEWRHLSCMNAP